MLTHAQLVTLHRSLKSERVLSVYLDGTMGDPAKQRSWRLQLEHSLHDLRTWLADSSHDERGQLERCIRLLEGELAAFSGGVGAPGWVSFITAKGVRDAHHLPVQVPTLAVWSTGACVSPYTRALKETRPVVVVISDARKVEVHRYHIGKLDRVETLRAHHVVEPPSHMGGQGRQGFHTGTRGTAGRDSAQRSLLAGRDRMLAEAVERIGDLAGTDGWIVLGGIPRVVARLAQSLVSVTPHRVLELEGLDVHASDAQLANAARSGAATLRDAADARQLADITNLAEAGGLGVVGPAATRRALERSCVHELYLTLKYLEDHAAEAESAVRAALDQDALIEEVSGDAAKRLDDHGGMAARLRYRVSGAEGALEGAAKA